MPVIWEPEKCIDALRLAIPKRQNYLWLQDGYDSKPLYSLPWREVWCEIANSEIKDLFQEGQQKEGLWPVSRQVVAVLDEPEKTVTRVFPFDRLMPLYFLNGQNNSDESYERIRQGSSMLRQLIRMKLLAQLQRISRGTLVVCGGNDTGQWQQVLNVLFCDGILPDVSSIQVFLLGPLAEMKLDLARLGERKQDIYVWDNNLSQLVELLADYRSLSYTGHEILVGKVRVPVADIIIGAVSRIDEDYYLIESKDLEEVNEVDTELFNRFMAEMEPCWKGFSAGFDMDRSYKPLDYKEVKNKNLQSLSRLGDGLSNKNASLVELLEYCLEISKMEIGGNWTVTIPAERGSGVSTLLWSSVFKLARIGYPVLILRQGLRRIDYKALTTFLTRLNREARVKSGKDSDEVPVIIVCDIEHQGIDDVSKLASLLHNDGRLCLVLRAIDKNELGKDDKGEDTYRARGQEIRCKPFKAEVDNQEITKLRKHLLMIKERYQLGYVVPSEESWQSYQEKSAVMIPKGPGRRDRQQQGTQPNGNIDSLKTDSVSLFWVGLRFFINQQWTPDRLETQLIQNIEELNNKNPQIALFVYSIAVSTRFRLALPVTVLVHAYKINDWVQFIDDLNSMQSMIPYIVNDYLPGDTMMIRFRHTAFAEVVLKHLIRLLRDSDTKSGLFSESQLIQLSG